MAEPAEKKARVEEEGWGLVDDDVLGVVLGFLCAIDARQLAMTCRDLKRRVTRVLPGVLRAGLGRVMRGLGLRTSVLPYPVAGKEWWVSGSAVWRLMVAGEWPTPVGDMDIFCSHAGAEPIRAWLVSQGMGLQKVTPSHVYMEGDQPGVCETWHACPCPLVRDGAAWKAALRRRIGHRVDRDMVEDMVSRRVPPIECVHYEEQGVAPPGPVPMCQGDSRCREGALVQVIIRPDARSGQFHFRVLENWFNGRSLEVHHPERVLAQRDVSRIPPSLVARYVDSALRYSFRSLDLRIQSDGSDDAEYAVEVIRANGAEFDATLREYTLVLPNGRDTHV